MDQQLRRKAKAHLMSWAAGCHRPEDVPTDAVATIVAAEREHALALTDCSLVADTTFVFAPGDDASGVIGYEGSFGDIGEEVSVSQDADVYVATQDYVSSPFMSVVGPTIVRLTGTDDVAAFCGDAEQALHSGKFADFLTSPSVVLADQSSISAHHRSQDGPHVRLYVHADSTVSTSLNGAPLGTLGDGIDHLSRRWTEHDHRDEEFTSRGWLGRYLTAVEALRTMTAHGIVDLQVSGFGHRLTHGIPIGTDAVDLAEPDAPLVLWNDRQAYVVSGSRVFAVGGRAAAGVEALVAGMAEAVDAKVVDAVTAFFAAHGLPLAEEVVR